MIIRYQKSVYQAKIIELEGYYAQLEQHLARMEELRSHMFDFWNDPDAQTTGQVLVIQIRQVRNAMTRTADMLSFYKQTVEKLDGVGGINSDLLEQALGILNGTGI